MYNYEQKSAFLVQTSPKLLVYVNTAHSSVSPKKNSDLTQVQSCNQWGSLFRYLSKIVNLEFENKFLQSDYC